MGVFKAKGSPYWQYATTVKGARYRGSTGLDIRAASKAEARQWLAEERRKKILGLEEKKTLTLSQGFGKYELEHLQFKAAYKSIQPKINHVLAYFGHNTGIHEIDQNELEKYILHCRTESFRRKVYSPTKEKMVEVGKPKKVSVATINRRISAFRAMHTKARKSWKVKVQEIAFDEMMLTENTVMNNTLAEDAAQILWDAAPPHIQHFIMFSLCTGWRMTNVLTLNGQKQIDLKGLIMWTIGKGEKLIETPITDALAQYIQLHGLHEKELVCDYWGTGEPVKSIKTAWKTLFKNTKIKPIRIHDMRHTFGTWLYKYTRDQRAIQEALAHSDIKTSIRYTHSNKDMLREQMNKLPVKINQIGEVK